MAGRYKPTHQKKKRRAKRKESSFLRTALTLCFCVLAFVFSAFLWREALRVSSQEQGSVSASGEALRPQVGDPPYRVATDAGHGGNDPGARGVVEEKDMTAATASVLLAWLEQDPNYIPLRTRDAFDQTATPAERAAAANAQAPQLLLSIHGNSAANGSSATGFECYPSVPGRTWHAESYYFAQKLAEGMQNAGAHLRGRGGIRYIYYLENDQKQLVESTHTEVRAERSFTLLEDVNCPVVLAEQCFVTNADDVERFGSEQGCKRTARIYYEAICAYFGTRRCRMQTNDSQNGEETFPVPKIKMPQPKSSGPPDRRDLREGKVLIFRICIFV